MNSISNRLTLYVLAGSLVLLVFVAAALDYLFRGVLRDEFDRGLVVRADSIAALTEFDAGVLEFDYESELLPLFHADAKNIEYFVLSYANGQEIARSHSLVGQQLSIQWSTVSGDEPKFSYLTLPDGRTGRAVYLSFRPRLETDENIDRDEEDEEHEDEDANDAESEDSASLINVADPTTAPNLRLFVARGTEDLTSLARKMRITLGSGFAALMLGMVVLVRLAVRSGLRPMRVLAAEVADLDEDKLNRRVSRPKTASELVSMSDQLNGLLEQLESAFRRERGFSANVAHELRTPIAELRSYAEVGKRWPRDHELAERFFSELVGLADDMERTVVNLLMLSRLESGDISTEVENVNLADLIDRLWLRHQTSATTASIKLTREVPLGLKVSTDPDKFALVLSNLFSNAISHSPPGSEVVVKLQQNKSEVDLLVRNKTDELDETDLPHLFERFWRKDQARTSGRHVGLGLSIVKSLCDVLELRVKPRIVNDRELEVALEGLPLAAI